MKITQKHEVFHNNKWHTVNPINMVYEKPVPMPMPNVIYFNQRDLGITVPAPAAPVAAKKDAPGLVQGLMCIARQSENYRVSDIAYAVLDTDRDIIVQWVDNPDNPDINLDDHTFALVEVRRL